jgi:hypothetical protein
MLRARAADWEDIECRRSDDIEGANSHATDHRSATCETAGECETMKDPVGNGLQAPSQR